MKKLHKVTILGILLGFAGCLFGCEAFYRQVPQEEQTIDPEAQAREAVEIEAKLSMCREYFEKGQLDKVRAVLVEVLERRQDDPQALYYWEKLNTDLYATVYPGQTLSGIAAYYYDDGEKWTILAGANGIRSPEKLGPYQRVRVPWLPACGEDKNEAGRLGSHLFGSPRPTKIILHPVQEGDSLAELAKQHYGDKSLRYFLADYNRIAGSQSLKSVSSLKIPVFPERKEDTTKKDRETLSRANLALKNKEYEEACRYFSSVPKNSPYRKEARSAMGRCKTEGASHYERLGDEALQNSKPTEACRYWKTALRLDPGRQQVEKKLEEAEDLVEALDLLPTLP